MYLVPCSGCSTIRELKDKPKPSATLCRSCSLASRSLKPKIVYTRTCIDCGDIATLKHKSNATRCVPCSSKILGKQLSQGNIKEDKDKKRYTYFCPTCSSVRVMGAKRKGIYCGDCSRRYGHLIQPKIYYDYELNKMVGKPMRYFAMYTDYPVKTKAQAGFVKCRSHSKIGTRDVRKINLKAKVAKLPEPVYTNREKVVITTTPRINREEENAKCRAMVDGWLRNNKPTVIESPKLPDSMIGQTDSSMYIKGY